MKKITSEEVLDAARRISESGENPSAPKIRKIIGRGGMATIQKYLEVWRDSEEGVDASKTEIPEMPEQLQGDSNLFIKQIWAAAKTTSDRQIQAERDQLAIDREEIELRLADAIEVSESQEDEIEKLNEQVESQKQTVFDKDEVITEKANIVAELQKEVAILSERCSQNLVSLDASKEREKDFKNEIEKINRQVESQKQTLLDKDTKIVDQANLLSELKEEVAVLSERCSQVQTSIETAKERENDLKAQLSDQYDRLTKSELSVKTLTSHSADLKRDAATLDERCAQYESQLKEFKEREAMLTKQLNELSKGNKK